MNIEEITDRSFSKPAEYEIEIQGELTEESIKHLGGLELKKTTKKQGYTVSKLTGRISDQSALSGILNALYNMHMMVLSVNIVEDKNRSL